MSELQQTEDERVHQIQKSRGTEYWKRTEIELDDVPFKFLIRQAKEPTEGDYDGARCVAGETAELVLREFDSDVKASGIDLGRLIGAHLGVPNNHQLWNIYYDAVQSGYFHEVGEVAFIAD
mgnify:FL=1